MTALAGVELESLVSEPDALTTRPPPISTITDLLSSEVAKNSITLSDEIYFLLVVPFNTIQAEKSKTK